MKKLVGVLVGIAILFAANSQGVEKGKGKWRSMSPEQKANSNSNWMAQRLGLSEDQKSKVLDVNKTYFSAIKSANENYKGDSLKAKRKEAVKTAAASREASLKTILTTEQYTKLGEIRKERKEKKKGKGEGKGKGKGDGKGKGKGGETKPKKEDKVKSGDQDDDGGEGEEDTED